MSLKFGGSMLNSSPVPSVFVTLGITCCQCLESFKLGTLSCFHCSGLCSSVSAVHPFLLQQVVVAEMVVGDGSAWALLCLHSVTHSCDVCLLYVCAQEPSAQSSRRDLVNCHLCIITLNAV